MESLSPFLQGSFIPCFMPVYPGAPQKSTGPKTEAGKNASKLNAIRHGLSSNLFLVEHEDEDEFNAFRDGFFTEHAPSGPTETFLVEQMIAAAWRIRRIHATEAAFWNLKMAYTDERIDDEFENPPQSRYLAHAHEGRFGFNSVANNLARYESRLERAFYKALHELERLRVGRSPRTAGDAHVAEIGFVSPTPKIVPPPAQPEPPQARIKPLHPPMHAEDSQPSSDIEMIKGPDSRIEPDGRVP